MGNWSKGEAIYFSECRRRNGSAISTLSNNGEHVEGSVRVKGSEANSAAWLAVFDFGQASGWGLQKGTRGYPYFHWLPHSLHLRCDLQLVLLVGSLQHLSNVVSHHTRPSELQTAFWGGFFLEENGQWTAHLSHNRNPGR